MSVCIRYQRQAVADPERRFNTCVESTLRGALERDYHTTVISDAVAAFNFTELKASVEINYPIYAHTILTADKFEEAMAALK